MKEGEKTAFKVVIRPRNLQKLSTSAGLVWLWDFGMFLTNFSGRLQLWVLQFFCCSVRVFCAVILDTINPYFMTIFWGVSPWLWDFKSQIPVARWSKLKKKKLLHLIPHIISHIKVTLLFSFVHFSFLNYCTTHSSVHVSLDFVGFVIICNRISLLAAPPKKSIRQNILCIFCVCWIFASYSKLKLQKCH